MKNFPCVNSILLDRYLAQEDAKEIERIEHENMLDEMTDNRDAVLIEALHEAIRSTMENMHKAEVVDLINQLIVERYFHEPTDEICQQLLSDDDAIDFILNRA